MKEVFKDIWLDLIDTEGQSVREVMDDDHVVELAMSISKHGLLEPIVVQAGQDGRYQLLAGFHRLAAFYRLRRDTIPCHVRTEETGPVKGIALIENIIRRDMSLSEEVEAVAYLNEDEKLSPSQICDLLGKSRAWVDRRLAMPNFPQDVRREMFDGNIEIGKAEIIARLEDPGTRALVLNQVISGKLTSKQTDDLVSVYLEAPSVQGAIEAGLKTQKEIQAQAPATRRCEACLGIKRIEHLYFMPICTECLRVIQENMNPSAAKEVIPHGD